MLFQQLGQKKVEEVKAPEENDLHKISPKESDPKE